MAKKEGGTSASKMNSKFNAKLGDIHTAAASTMEPRAFEMGYAPNDNELTNAMPAIIRGKNKA